MIEGGDFFRIRREQLEKQKKIGKKRNETFLKVKTKDFYYLCLIKLNYFRSVHI